MSDATLTPITTTKKRKRSSTPRAKAAIDPGIKAIRDKMALEVAAYRSSQASAKLLDTFISKRLPKLTPEDRAKLFKKLEETETPELLPRPVAQPNPDSVEHAMRYAESLTM